MTKTIYTRIINKEITSVELKSVLGRELYIYNGNYWTDVLNEFGFSFEPGRFCEHIDNYILWADCHNEDLEILEGKAEFRSDINAAKELLKEWLEYNELFDFMSLYSALSARQKEAVVLILRHSTVCENSCTPIMCPTTSELSLLWKTSVKKQKHKANLLLPVIGNNYKFVINLFTSEVVDYVDMDIIEGNF